jgi:hypothetical protein
VRKLLIGVDPAKLARQFENARSLLRNWDAFACDIVERRGSAFDTRLWPWLAEIRALDFLRAERGAIAATAIPRRRKRKTPDVGVHRRTEDSLAEVKLVTPNCNVDTIEEELEIAAIRWPEMRQYEAQVGRSYCEKDIVIYYEEPGSSAATLLLNEDVNAIKATVNESLRVLDPGVALSVRY